MITYEKESGSTSDSLIITPKFGQNRDYDYNEPQVDVHDFKIDLKSICSQSISKPTFYLSAFRCLSAFYQFGKSFKKKKKSEKVKKLPMYQQTD